MSGEEYRKSIFTRRLKEFHYEVKTKDEAILLWDAFDILKSMIKKGKTFDVVVIDPPSFAKQRSQIDLAKKKYRQLATLGVQLVAREGWLVLASCSSRVSSKSFFDINKSVINQSGKDFVLEFKTSHDIDHPISFSEGAYLKCGYYKLMS